MSKHSLESSSTEEDETRAIAKIFQTIAIKKHGLSTLPTDRTHVSFSELSSWSNCSWQHKLRHVDGIDLSTPGWPLSFGTALHAACEHYLRTRKLDITIATNQIEEAWDKHEFDDRDTFLQQATDILTDVPAFMDTTFEEWLYVDAEHLLYEPLNVRPYAFKGYIDGVISARSKRGRRVIWLIDWKTSSWGWNREKKSDEITRSQLIYYKNFWTNKTEVLPKDVRCGFVLLKRSAKPGEHCELVPVSVGNVTTDRSLQVINNMVGSLNRGMALKNKLNCRWCDYRGTKHCLGTW